MLVFVENLSKLAELVAECIVRKERGEPTIKLGLTPISAYSYDEFKNHILNQKLKIPRLRMSRLPETVTDSVTDLVSDSTPEPVLDVCDHGPRDDDEELPDEFDWRDLGRVSRVYDQGDCGSCFVWASISSLESQYMIREEIDEGTHFSVEALMSCMAGGGCDGGYPDQAMKRMVEVGVALDKDYPYKEEVSLQDLSEFILGLGFFNENFWKKQQ